MQLSIDFNPARLARRTDPGTSHEAAERVQEFGAGQCAKILECLQRFGPQGPEQIGQRLNLDPYAVRKRLPELQRAKKAEPTGENRMTISGRHERVWMAHG